MVNLGVLSLDHPHAGGNHLPALKYMGDRIKVSAVFHSNREAAEPWLNIFNAKYYDNKESFLSDPEINAVLITSKNNCHAKDTVAAAEAGKDILCDKPIAITLDECALMAKAVQKNKVRFHTTFPVRFNRSVQYTKQIIDEGKLGEIKAIMATNHGCMYEPGAPAWVMTKAENGGGSLIDHTVHVADIIRWITKDEFSDVFAQTQHALRDYIETEDIAVLHGHLESGVIYQIDASWSRRKNDVAWGDVGIRIVGTKGSVTLDIYNNQAIELSIDGNRRSLYPNLIVYEHGKIFDDYIAAFNGKPSIGAGLVDGLRTIELVYAAYESMGKNQRVEVKKTNWQLN
jgi:predicted dehydrogenase